MTSDESKQSAPPLMSDRSFWGLNLTQFLGAFNDNLFKQLVMLICVDQAKKGGQDWQGLGMILFAFPFILFSGFAGFLSDRFSKRTIIILCKAAELLIVLLGLIGFISGSMFDLLGVLCLMGVHSSFFGPSKFGILPEMLRRSDLPKANGMMLMATFLAIIFGLSAAGAAKHAFEHSLWIASLPCLFIALTGLGSSFLLRSTPVAQPHLSFDWSSVVLAPDTRATLKSDRTLLGVLLMSSVFWFVGGTIYPPTINAFGKEQLRLNDLTTGIMAASTGLGIAVGCVLAGILSKDRVRGWLVRTGAWGLTVSLALLSIPGPGMTVVRAEIHQTQLKAKLAAKPTGSKDDSQGTTTCIMLPDGPEVIAECLTSRVTLRHQSIALKELLNQIQSGTGRQIVCQYDDIGINPQTEISVSVDDVSLKSALDTVFRGHSVRYGEEADALLIGSAAKPLRNSVDVMALFETSNFHRGSLLGPYGSVVALIAVGLFAGFYSVPLQVYLQTAAPNEQKGRIIGAFNLFNWIGIAGSGIVYILGREILVVRMELPPATLFGFAALLLLPVALFYRPPESKIEA